MDEIKELRKLYKKEKNGKMKIRILCIIYNLEGFSCRQIAKMLFISPSTVSRWVRRWKEKKDLQDKTRPGHPFKLSSEQLDELTYDLKKSPKEYGYHYDVWTTNLVWFHIKKKYGKEYNKMYLTRLLRKLGFELIKPRQKLYKRNEEEVKKYTEELPKKVQEAKREGKEITFIDETVFQISPKIRKAWFPRGSKPFLKINWDPAIKVVVYGALKGKEFLWAIYEKANIKNTKDFLSRIKNSIFVLDNARWHNVDGEIINLPRYSPEENPVEYIWRKAKMEFSNLLIKDKEELVGVVERIMTNISFNINFEKFGVSF